MGLTGTTVGQFVRKQRPPVEAVQWDGRNLDEIASWLGDDHTVVLSPSGDFVCVDDRFGAPVGYWIVRDGTSLSACCPGAFGALYREAIDA